MKKYRNLIALLLLVVITLVSYICLLLLVLPQANLSIIWCILIQLIGLAVGVFLAVVIHEGGHCFFGLLTGYKLVCFKFGPFAIVDVNNRYCIKIQGSQMGILGQCLMAPPVPHKKKTPKFFLYNAGGLIFSYAFLLFFILLFLLINNIYIRWLLLPMIIVDLFLSINNSIYTENGINDVCNYVMVKKNPRYIEAICYQLEMMANIYKGKRYGAKTKYGGYYENKLNHISLPVVQFKFYAACDHSDFNKAKEYISLIENNYANILFPIQRVAVSFDLMWADLVIDNNMDKFRRHFRRMTSVEKSLCGKADTDINCYYQIYERIYKNNFEIEDLIEQLTADENSFAGELLSLKKRMHFLLVYLRKDSEANEDF